VIASVEEGDRSQHQAVATTSGALTTNPALPAQEQGIVTIRAQAAVVRALVDELDQFLPGPHGAAVLAQVAEELARLSNKLLQLAGWLSMGARPPT
jgi:hypothetical protein